MTFAPLGDSAVVVTLGNTLDESTMVRVRTLAAALEREYAAGILDVVPAYTKIAVYYDLSAVGAGEDTPFQRVCRIIQACAAKVEHGWPDLVRQKLGGEERRGATREIEIPVCYGGEFAPDIAEVARHCGVSEDGVATLHSGGRYVVHAVGFTPGFAYLGGLPEKLITPRRPSPRPRVPVGSVGIGGMHTGVYPLASPGGWQLIGRTPLPLFRPEDPQPSLLRVGDQVRFRAISPEEFFAWK